MVLHPARGFPRKFTSSSGKQGWLVQGRGRGGRMVEAIYSLDEDAKTAFVFHAMPLTTRRRRGGR